MHYGAVAQGAPASEARMKESLKKDLILIIEDDIELCKSLSDMLKSEGFVLIIANSGESGLQKVSPEVDLVVLDVMLPGISGIDVCTQIRKSSFVPILFLTAKTEDADKLLGLYAGGDDYLVKPFSFPELMARIHALLRRTRQYNSIEAEGDDRHQIDQWILRGGLRINSFSNEVYRDNKRLQLTEIEYQILVLLAKHPGVVFSLRTIFETIWDTRYMANSGNVVTVHIRNLRKKVEKDPQKPAHILTAWGKGYQFAKER